MSNRRIPLASTLNEHPLNLRQLVVFLVLMASISLQAQSALPLLDSQTEQAILNELSGELAKEFVIDISRFDRVQASEGLYEACEMIQSKLADYGITDGVIERFP